MKLRDVKDLKNKSVGELRQMVKDAKNDLFSMQMDQKLNKLKNTSGLSGKKDDIARLLTVLKEKEKEKKS